MDSGDSFKNADIGVQCKSSSDKICQRSQRNKNSTDVMKDPQRLVDAIQNANKDFGTPTSNTDLKGSDRIPPTSMGCSGEEMAVPRRNQVGFYSSQPQDFDHDACVDGQEQANTDVPTSSRSSSIDNMITLDNKMFRVDDRDQDLLLPDLSWDEKVVFVLNMVRCREIKPTYYDPPTRFCHFNIALFDLDKESVFKREAQFNKVPDTPVGLAPSINIISIKIVESHIPYPIDIYGTVLARDMIDYRCVYLFKRGRDNPQRITATDGNLTLTGPYRALAAIDVIYFEFDLKIKCKDGVDQDFSKCLTQTNVVCASDTLPRTRLVGSCLSKVELEFAYVFKALEASVEVNVLKKRKSCFYGKITAGDNKHGIIVLYDSKVAGTKTILGRGGSVWLTRHVVSVPWGSDLVLNFSLPRAKRKSISLEPCGEELIFSLGTYKLQVKATWMSVLRDDRLRSSVGLEDIGRGLVLTESPSNLRSD